MIVEEIGGWREFLRLRSAWEELAAQDPDGALLGHDWVAQCWKCCAELRRGERVRLVGVRDGQCGGRSWAALLALRHNAKTRRLCFLEERRSQRLDLLALLREESWARLAEYFRSRRDWDRLDLQFLREPSAQAILASWPAQGLAVRERGQVRQRRIRLRRPWAEIEADFNSYLRANFRRRFKRLQTLGAVRVTTHVRPDGLQPHLHACFTLEQQGWKGSQGTAILDDDGLHRFYRQLAFRLAAARRFCLYCLRVGERLVAFEYCVADPRSRRLSSLKIAYDEALRTASPGTVLRWLILQQAQADFDTYEFLGDDAAWKADWTSEIVELRHLRVYNRTLRGQGWLWRARAAEVAKKVAGGWR